jgi:ABC-type uncharacterized transport system substrate-binding protein
LIGGAAVAAANSQIRPDQAIGAQPSINDRGLMSKTGSLFRRVRARPTSRGVAAVGAIMLAVPAAHAHPHVFAETKTEIIGRDGALEALRHVWRFDEFFSATVLLEFDKDADGKLDEAETANVAATIKRSTAEFNFFQNVYDNGADVRMDVPGDMTVGFEGPQMILIFESRPTRTIALKGDLSFGIFDETFYTSLEFINDGDLSADGFPAACSFTIVRPDPEQAIAENETTLTEQFFAESEQNDFSRMFATRLEAKC